MADNNNGKIILGIDIPKSSAQINADIKKLQKQLKPVDLTTKSEDTVRGINKLGAAFQNQMNQAALSFSKFFSAGSGVTLLLSQTKEAVSELKNLDSILTDISKNSALTDKQLAGLGNSAFDVANKYGRTAKDYLNSVQTMYRAGFDNAGQLSELSLLAQAISGMDVDAADNYLIAGNAAYGLKGNMKELNKILDGQNAITAHTAVSMLDMAQATSEAASTASQYGIEIDELSALIAAAASKTHESGTETGAAVKALFTSLQDTDSAPVKEALDAVNVSMTETVNGSEKLKTPVRLLKELSEVFTGLEENDGRRAALLSAIGGEDHGNALSAILSDWTSFEEMLDLYSSGMGSAAAEAERYTQSWEGSLNRLSNTWTDTVGNLVDSDAVVTAVNGLNGLLSVVNDITENLGSLGTIGLGAGLFGIFQNVDYLKTPVCPLYI